MQEVVSCGDAVKSLFASTAEVVEQVSTVTSNYDNILQQLSDQLEVTNTLLLRITDQLDIVLAVGVAVIIVGVFYTILKGFTRF